MITSGVNDLFLLDIFLNGFLEPPGTFYRLLLGPNLHMGPQWIPLARLRQSSRILHSFNVEIVSLHLSIECPRLATDCNFGWSVPCTDMLMAE